MDHGTAQRERLDQAKAALRQMIEQSAALTRQAVGTLSQVDRVFIDYNDRVNALMQRDDAQGVVLRGSLQAMEEANRIASRGRPDYPHPRFRVPTIPPDTTGAANLDYEVR